ncbi:MAG: hypothetical protein P1U89_10510 [Verrucomicrobiales bacterium]|nr:hypothetical protein [Verrucomicrobiales bacterium]
MKANCNFLSVISACLLGLFTTGFSHAQKPPKGIVPAEIEVLASVLPKQVKEWKLIASRGWQGQDEWLESSATRTFEKVTLNEEAQPVTQKVKLRIRDTGKFPGSDISVFDDFTPGKEELTHRLYMNSTPVIVVEKGSRLYAQFLIQGRFILSISFFDVPKNELGKWFETMNLPLLSGVDDGPVVNLPKSYVSRSIDELKGKDNASIFEPTSHVADEEE